MSDVILRHAPQNMVFKLTTAFTAKPVKIDDESASANIGDGGAIGRGNGKNIEKGTI